MDVFKIPLTLKMEPRKTIRAQLVGEECIVQFPAAWAKRKKHLATMIDRVYWHLMAQNDIENLRKRVNQLNQIYFGFDYQDVHYHRQFGRWGSCSTLRNINLSHRLIGAPEQIRDYVILHELAHLKQFNHGKEFWALVNRTGYQPKMVRKEIALYGQKWQNEYYQWCRRILNVV
ncbi:MAG TPA: hypothetical protein DDW50_02785 [Firmicutes bacterium]|jgi:predicted metal-dependent hydrolase|nr:hypothetical protein [Bacillota bacterium]